MCNMFGYRISKTCIHATAIALVHIYCVQHQGIFAKENCNNSTSSTWNIYRLIDRLQWKSFATIQDKDEEAVFSHPVKQQVYNINRINSSRAMENIHSLMFPDVNIIMAVNDSSTLKVVAGLDKFDFESHRTTDFRHHSMIVLIMKNDSNLENVALAVQHLENVAAIIVKDTPWTESTVEQIYTLHFVPTSRVFTTVDLSDKCNASLLTRLFPNTQYGYNRRRVQASTVETPMGVVKEVINGKIVFSGFCIRIWHEIATALNLSYDLGEPEDGEWGSFINGQWTGVVGQLIKREIDIAVTDLSVHYGRSQVIDYINPAFLVDGGDIVYRIKTDSTRSFFLIARPLKVDVYLTFIALTAGLLLIFIIIDNHQYLCEVPICKGMSTIFSRQLSSMGLEFVGSLLKQGFQIHAKSKSGSVLLASFSILIVLISSVYSANLIASLTAQSGATTLSSIDDLVDSDYTVGIYTAGIDYSELQNSERPKIRRLRDKMRKLSEHNSGIFLNNRTSHMIRVKEGTHAHITYRAIAAKYMAEDCRLALIGDPITWAEERISFGILKGSTLKADLDKVMYKLKESGLLEEWWKQWNARDTASSSCEDDSSSVRTITLREVGGGFLVVCGGLGLSSLVLIVEICRQRLQRKSN